MIEALFGSTTPLWAPQATGAFGFPPSAPVGSAMMYGPFIGPSAAANTVASGLPPPASMISAPIAPAGPAYGYALPLNPIPGEAALGGSIPLLLATVAMRRGQPHGPATDQEIEDFVYDAFELMPGTADVEVRCDSGRATLTGNVLHKRLKRDLGEILWAIPGVNDVQNNITIVSRRRARTATREGEPLPAVPARKPA
jgi:hypothetical protein